MNQHRRPQRVLMVGATGGLARAIASALAEQGNHLILAGRDLTETSAVACDLRVRYQTETDVQRFEALDTDSHEPFFQACVDGSQRGLDGIVVCHGYMAPQDEARHDFSQARRMIEVNFTSFVSILNLAANYFEQRKRGFICALSSVAGDRGRPSNYLYGSTKAALTAYLQGLRARMARSGVAVITVKPGFIDTAMTWGRAAAGPVGSPEQVGRDVCRAICKRRNVVYTPWFYRWIMTIIRWIPDPLFKRLDL